MGHILIKSQHYGNTRTMCDDVNDGWLKLLYIYERRFCFHYVIYVHVLFRFHPFKLPKPSVINSNIIKYNVTKGFSFTFLLNSLTRRV